MRYLPIIVAIVLNTSLARADERPAATGKAPAPAPVPVPAFSAPAVPAVPAAAPAASPTSVKVLSFPQPVTAEQLRAAGISVASPAASCPIPAVPFTAAPLYALAPVPCAATNGPVSRIDHLRAALRELDAADAKAAAEAVREEIAREEQSAARQLEKKLAELAAVQDEVDRLRRETKTGPQVLVKVKVIDVDVTKLRGARFDFRVSDDERKGADEANSLIEQLKGTADGEMLRRVLPKGHAVLALFDVLESQELATVECEPNLVGLITQPAAFLSGGQFPVPTGPDAKTVTMKPYGTKVDFTPRVQADGRLQMDLMVSLSSIDMEHAAKLRNGTTIPALQVCEMNAGFECNSGDTLVMATIGESRKVDPGWYFLGQKLVPDSEHLVRRFVLVTPQLVDASDIVPVATAPAGASAPQTR